MREALTGDFKSDLILFSKGFVAAFLCALIVCTVLPSQMASEGCQCEHDRNIAHVARVFGGLLLLFLVVFLHLNVSFFVWVWLFMVSFVVMSQILLIFEHFVAILALKRVIVLESKSLS